jgi:hypothetical protein
MFNYLKANLFNDLFMSLRNFKPSHLLLQLFSDGIFFRVLHGCTRMQSLAGANKDIRS